MQEDLFKIELFLVKDKFRFLACTNDLEQDGLRILFDAADQRVLVQFGLFGSGEYSQLLRLVGLEKNLVGLQKKACVRLFKALIKKTKGDFGVKWGCVLDCQRFLMFGKFTFPASFSIVTDKERPKIKQIT